MHTFIYFLIYKLYVDQKRLRIITLVEGSHLYSKVVSTKQHSLESKRSLAFLRCLSIGTFVRYSKIGRLYYCQRY